MAHRLVGAEAIIEVDIRKERRRLRDIGRQDPDIMIALARVRDRERAEEHRQRRALQYANKMMMTNKKLKQQTAVAESTLRKRKQHIADEKQLSEARRSVKSFRLSFLGDGVRMCGGAVCRKRRDEVLDRLSRLGTGLSPPQRHDWTWFKEAWQGQMLDEHGGIGFVFLPGGCRECWIHLSGVKRMLFLSSCIPKPDVVSSLTLRWKCQGDARIMSAVADSK